MQYFYGLYITLLYRANLQALKCHMGTWKTSVGILNKTVFVWPATELMKCKATGSNECVYKSNILEPKTTE